MQHSLGLKAKYLSNGREGGSLVLALAMLKDICAAPEGGSRLLIAFLPDLTVWATVMARPQGALSEIIEAAKLVLNFSFLARGLVGLRLRLPVYLDQPCPHPVCRLGAFQRCQKLLHEVLLQMGVLSRL
jgi:hypothetical protein